MSDLRTKLYALIDEIVDAIERGGNADLVDQKSSPLGRERHCRLVREGILPGSKDGRNILVKRSDIDAYLAKTRVVKVNVEDADERAAARILSDLGRKKAS